MKPLLMLTVLASLAAPAFAAEETAPEPAVPALTYGVESDFLSRYIWRGIPLSEGSVQQTSFWVSAKDFTFTLFSNYDFSPAPDMERNNEVDFTLAYTRDVQGTSVEPSVNFYTYPDKHFPSTAEFTLKLSRPVGALTLGTSHTFDIDAYRGAYFGDVSVGHEQTLNSRLTMSGEVLLGWASRRFNEVNIGPARSALNLAEAKVSWTYTGRNYYVRPHVGVTSILDRNLRGSLSDPTIFTAGLAVGAEF